MAVQIKTFVVLNARGRVVGVRLTKASAVALYLEHPGGHIEPHTAHKQVTPGSNRNTCKDRT